MNIKTFLDDARLSIGDFCMNECNAYCCKKATLPLTKEEAYTLKPLIPKNKIIKDDTYHLDLLDGCPFLKESMCTIHKEQIKPQICTTYPIFETENQIKFSTACPAVQQNKFYGIIKQLLQSGYTLENPTTLSKK